MNCRSSAPAVGREGGAASRIDGGIVGPAPYRTSHFSILTQPLKISSACVLANNGVGNPRARVNHLPPLLRRTSRGGEGSCHGAATLFTARADVTELLRC